MRVPRLLLVALLLVTPVWAGCLSGDEEQRLREQQADVTAQLGGLEGVVTDTSIQPIVGANVTLVETGEMVQTASDGSYAFSRLAPGAYTIRVNATGFVPDEATTQVTAGQAAVIDVVLSHLQLQEAFQQTIEMVGFVECGIGWRQTVYEEQTPLIYDSALAACAVPNLYLGGNATNDRFLHRFDLEAPLHTVVYELDWQAGDTPATDPPLRTIMEVQGFINANGSRIMDTRGTSPIQVQLTPERWDGIEANFTQLCQGTNGTEAQDDYCGYNFRDDGWPMVLRVFATGDCLEAPASGCLVLQQEFTHYVSAFYNQPAPPGYSILGT